MEKMPRGSDQTMMDDEKEGQREEGVGKQKGREEGVDLYEKKRPSQSDSLQCDRKFKEQTWKDKSWWQYEYNTK